MLLSIETDSYNERRYGKPWIAKVTFENSKRGDFHWGDWIGEKGMGGLLEIIVEPGDIVATGQKDYRKPRNSAPDWHYINDSGDLVPTSKVEAYKRYREAQDEKNPIVFEPRRKLSIV